MTTEFCVGIVVGIFLGQTYRALPNIKKYVTFVIEELEKYKTPEPEPDPGPEHWYSFFT